MNYIYDIILNFNDEIYDFYDWNQNDYISHIRKIPFFKISSIDLYNIKNNNVKFSYSILEEVKDRTEIFTNKGVKKLEYSFLLTDGLDVVAILVIDNKIKYSKMLLDEELECLEMSNHVKEKIVDYKIIKSKEKMKLKTRKELEIGKYIEEQLYKLIKENNMDKIKYLYYECYDEELEEPINMKLLFKKKFKDEKKVYDLLKLIQSSK